jgi:ABC-type branched-subunit amino acid transport system substrate-binding protein
MSDRPEDRRSNGWSRRCIAAILAIGLLAVSACGDETPTTTRNTDEAIRLYGSDGNMTSSFGDTFKDQAGLLNGMRGTSPLTPLSEEFKNRLRAVDSRLKNDFLYAAEGYDAVVIAALAAETARSVEGPQIAKFMTAVTITKDAGDAPCLTIQTCMDGVKAGDDIAYRGVSMKRSGLTDRGEPSSASYGSLIFGRSNLVDDAKTEFVAAGDEKLEAKEQPTPPSRNGSARGTTPLRIGALLPKTGDLAIAGPPIFAGVKLAIAEINAAGGVVGQPVVYVDGDDGTDPAKANAQVDAHIAAGVQVIVGAAASGISKAVIPKVIAAQRVLISPSATADELTDEPDGGMFFRTSPRDTLQSRALADVIMRYGAQKIVIVARDDSYGNGLASKVAEQLKAAGVKDGNLKVLKYEVRKDPKEYTVDQFAGLATDTANFKPDSVLVIGFEESGNMIKALSAHGVKFHD